MVALIVLVSLVEGFTSAARRQPTAALRHARAVLGHAAALGISYDFLRWAWPLAARAACELEDAAATGELLALLDAYQPGYPAPICGPNAPCPRPGIRPDDDPAAAAFAAAISVAGRLHCQPLLERAADITPAQPAMQDQAAASPQSWPCAPPGPGTYRLLCLAQGSWPETRGDTPFGLDQRRPRKPREVEPIAWNLWIRVLDGRLAPVVKNAAGKLVDDPDSPTPEPKGMVTYLVTWGRRP